MSSFWDANEKEEFDVAPAGQITRHTESGKQLYRILQEDDTIKRVVEIGTWNGRGSTLCLIHGIQGKNVESFHSIECNREKHLAAVEFLDSQMEGNTTLLWGSIIDTAHVSSDAYRKNFPGLDTSESLRSWFDIDLKNCEAAPNVLKDLPEQIDFLLLDGGEYTTLNEFEILLPRCVGYIALDDTLPDKSRECRMRLVNSGDWKEIVQLDERNGFSIFISSNREMKSH
jgi:predicted O-methyltransferase YrrM